MYAKDAHDLDKEYEKECRRGGVSSNHDKYSQYCYGDISETFFAKERFSLKKLQSKKRPQSANAVPVVSRKSSNADTSAHAQFFQQRKENSFYFTNEEFANVQRYLGDTVNKVQHIDGSKASVMKLSSRSRPQSAVGSAQPILRTKEARRPLSASYTVNPSNIALYDM